MFVASSRDLKTLSANADGRPDPPRWCCNSASTGWRGIMDTPARRAANLTRRCGLGLRTTRRSWSSEALLLRKIARCPTISKMVMQADSPAPVSAAAQDNAADAPFPVARDYHLFNNGSKRILALDGGGVRGAISVAFLERIEQIFEQMI